MLQVRTLAALWLSSALLIAAGLALGMQALSTGTIVGHPATPITAPAPVPDVAPNDLMPVDLESWLRDARDDEPLLC